MAKQTSESLNFVNELAAVFSGCKDNCILLFFKSSWRVCIEYICLLDPWLAEKKTITIYEVPILQEGCHICIRHHVKHNTRPVMLQNMSDTPNLYLTNPTFKNIYSSTHPIPPSHIRCLVIWYYTLTNYFRENRNLLFRGYPIRHPNIVLTPWYNLTYTWCSFYCIMLFSVIKYYIKLFIYVTLYNFLSVWVLLWLSLT